MFAGLHRLDSLLIHQSRYSLYFRSTEISEGLGKGSSGICGDSLGLCRALLVSALFCSMCRYSPPSPLLYHSQLPECNRKILPGKNYRMSCCYVVSFFIFFFYNYYPPPPRSGPGAMPKENGKGGTLLVIYCKETSY